ncbi:FAD-binding oxidoreductase [Rhodoligotrophos appendicifer]|uniref:FAD-binding oxidoreductase n=1 Tax=Rhodoligotrophos appendicifer TaxID=987056 RepID=UPI0014790D38|nr:FAD-binding oxidoreductase [Rhodoligotrophos appendicifer]
MNDWRGIHKGQALCVLRPSTVEHVSKIVTLCGEQGVGIVPQGGNTGLTGGSTPDASGRQIILSTRGLKRIRALDPVDMTVVAEAGVTITELQAAADAAGTLFPLSFAAEGSATLGGAVATNAGGTAAVRYGSARDLLLGLEVVLPDGRIWNGLRRLHKDNAGYSLRHLFAGSEGTLGIVTAAVMKLAAKAETRAVAFCSLKTEADVAKFWTMLQASGDGSIRAAEYISGASLALVTSVMGLRSPIAEDNHYILVELHSPRADAQLMSLLESILSNALAEGIVTDVVIAQSEQQARDLWRLREDQTEAQRRSGLNLKHDIAVPVSLVGELLTRSRAALSRDFPDLLVVPFGHLGDGNIHMNVILPQTISASAATTLEKNVAEIIYGIAESLQGTFSAEHGIGTSKIELLQKYRSDVELDLMRRIKSTLDPFNIMNPENFYIINQFINENTLRRSRSSALSNFDTVERFTLRT